MTMEEIYTVCKLIFPDREVVRFNEEYIYIDWKYYGFPRRIWIEQFSDCISIDVSAGRLPSWFTSKVNYTYTSGRLRIFKGFKD